MNNEQFRRLVSSTPGGQNGSPSPRNPGSTPSSLGGKKSSFMPMTPRTVKGGIDVDFARQVRERNAASQPTKKFKAAAPKGVKYGAGYTDRAKARAEADDAETTDDKGSRITALEEQMKLGQISQQTFEALRDEITGGDISSTHLVKGLDRKLLERVRRGEDVLGGGGSTNEAGQPPDVDEELDRLGEKEVEVVHRDQAEKKGEMAPPPPVAGVKRSRNEIMAELKAQRKAAAEAKAAPALDGRWRKIGEKGRRSIEIDHKGREVLITVDEDGVVKKKVRKGSGSGKVEGRVAVQMPDESQPVLGSDAVMPELQPPANLHVADLADEDDDIFEGVGAEYNPLGDENSDVLSDEDDKDEDDLPNEKPTKHINSQPVETRAKELSSQENSTIVHRNYFKDAPPTEDQPEHDRMAGVQELLKKAAKLDSAEHGSPEGGDGEAEEDRQARLNKRAQMLAQQDRDFDDMDMGFGSSRYDDGEEGEEGQKIKLSEWKGGDDDQEDGEKGGNNKTKRKPKKRKGDANNMADIMRVIDGRKAGAK